MITFQVLKGYEKGQAEFIEFLIRNHSNKGLLYLPDTPLELVLILEADMLDETGALGVIWDAMMAGGKSAQDYTEAYTLLISHSCKQSILEENPMKTAKAREIWETKQRLLKDFRRELERDLAIDKT